MNYRCSNEEIFLQENGTKFLKDFDSNGGHGKYSTDIVKTISFSKALRCYYWKHSVTNLYPNQTSNFQNSESDTSLV